MKKTISAKALKVLRVIATERDRKGYCPVLAIGRLYKMGVRDPRYFRDAACDDASRRVVLEVNPGFPDGAAIGVDLDGRAWLAYQNESADMAFPLTARRLSSSPYWGRMASHVVRMIELNLLILTPDQIKAFASDMTDALDRKGALVDGDVKF